MNEVICNESNNSLKDIWLLFEIINRFWLGRMGFDLHTSCHLHVRPLLFRCTSFYAGSFYRLFFGFVSISSRSFQIVSISLQFQFISFYLVTFPFEFIFWHVTVFHLFSRCLISNHFMHVKPFQFISFHPKWISSPTKKS